MVNFATDPGTDVFLRGIDAGERARKARNAVSVDAAVRRGLSASLGAGGGAPLAPVPAVDGVTPPAAPSTPPAPSLAPAPRGAPPAAVAAPMRGRGGEPLEGAPDAPPVPMPALPPPPPPPPPAPAPRAAGPALAPPPAVAGGAQPVGDRYENVLRELAGVEGGGAAALGVMQQQDRSEAVAGRRRDQLARLSMYALKQGDVATGQYFANQAGIPLPQIQPGRGRGGAGGGGSVQQQARLLGSATLAARRLFGNDVGQAQRFTQAYIANGGDVAKALEAAGDPTQGPVRQYRWRLNPQSGQEELVGLRADGTMLSMTDDDGKPFVRAPQQRVVQTPGGYATVNPTDSTARPVTGQDGTQLQPPPRAGAAGAGGPRANGRPLNIEAKRQMLIDAGVDPREAALAAAGGSLSPNARAQAYIRIQSAVNSDMMIPPDKKGAEIDRRYREFEGRFNGGSPTSPTPAGALPRAPAAVPEPAAPVPQLAPPPAPVGVPAPPELRDTQRVRQNGVTYRVQNGQLVPERQQ